MTTKPARKNLRNNSTLGNSRITSAHGNSRTNSVRIASLRRLPDNDLLAGLLETRGTERAAQVAVVKYLVEVERRQPERKLRDQVRQIHVMSVKSDAEPQEETAHTEAAAPACESKVPATVTHADPYEVAELQHCHVSTHSAGSKMAQLIDNKELKNHGVRPGSGGDSSCAPVSVEETQAP